MLSSKIIFTPKIYKYLIVIHIIVNCMSKQVDLLGQYISQVLIPRLNRADILSDEGRFFEAVKKQESVIRVLYRESEDEKIQLNDWIEKIENIEVNAKQIKHEINHVQNNFRLQFMNYQAKKLYPILDWEIWSWLHKLGYFAGKNVYGPKIEDIDLKKADEV